MGDKNDTHFYLHQKKCFVYLPRTIVLPMNPKKFLQPENRFIVNLQGEAIVQSVVGLIFFLWKRILL